MSTIELQHEPMILRVANAIARYIGFDTNDTITSHTPDIQKQPEPARATEPRRSPLRLVANPPSVSQPEHKPGHKWQRHAQLRSYAAPLSMDARNGRHEAVRGLYAAREGALDVATEHFSRAAHCDEVDLTAVPGFWNLTRGQMKAAVEAYEQVHRYRDAAALDAHIETIFRPSLVGTELAPIVPRNPQPRVANN